MTAPNGLHAARDLAERQRDEAAQLLATVRQSQAAAQAQLDQLEGYARDTDARWSAASGRAASPEVMQHHYQFMQRLGQAIAMQQRTMDNHAHQVTMRTNGLREAEARLESLNQVLAQRRKAEAVQERRREQKAVDEMAALQYRKLAGKSLAGGY
jgi:flagellar FliJ protein